MGWFRRMRYRRYRAKRNLRFMWYLFLTFFCFFASALAMCFIVENLKIVIIAIIIIVAICLAYLTIKFIWQKHKKQTNSLAPTRKQYEPNPIYTSKNHLMTPVEEKFFITFKEIVGKEYIVQPQINLASIIDKNQSFKHRTELFRNIDFGIFNNSYELLLLIEINDPSHNSRERKERDKKVKEICNTANIPLITFWTDYGINKDYIRKRLEKYFELPAYMNVSSENEESYAPTDQVNSNYVLHYIYILTNEANNLMYVGMTSNLESCLYEHKNQLIDDFTKEYGIDKLVYFEGYKAATDAISRENELKHLTKAQKSDLINSFNPEWRDLTYEYCPGAFKE